MSTCNATAICESGVDFEGIELSVAIQLAKGLSLREISSKYQLHPAVIDWCAEATIFKLKGMTETERFAFARRRPEISEADLVRLFVWVRLELVRSEKRSKRMQPTSKQHQILQLLTNGLNKGEIAETLKVSVGWVKRQQYRLMKKWRVNRATQLIAEAAKLGYLAPA